MCRYFCAGFVNFMPRGKHLINYTNLFTPNEYKKKKKKDKRI